MVEVAIAFAVSIAVAAAVAGVSTTPHKGMFRPLKSDDTNVFGPAVSTPHIFCDSFVVDR